MRPRLFTRDEADAAGRLPACGQLLTLHGPRSRLSVMVAEEEREKPDPRESCSALPAS